MTNRFCACRRAIRRKFAFAKKNCGYFGVVRGLWTILHWRLGYGRHKVRVRGKVVAPLVLRARTSDLPMFAQTFIDGQYAFPLEPPATIVDAGANIGTASVYFALRFANARIIALEPDPSNFGILCENVAPFGMITPVRAALWTHRGKLHLRHRGRAKSEVQVVETGPDGSVPDVNCISINDVLQEYGLAQIDLLKMDIEGSESRILAGAREWSGKVRTLVVELHDTLAPDCVEAFATATADFACSFRWSENLVASRLPAQAFDALTGSVRLKRTVRSTEASLKCSK